MILQRRLLLSPNAATDEGGPPGSGDNVGTATSAGAGQGDTPPNTDVLEDQSEGVAKTGEGEEGDDKGEGQGKAAKAVASSALTKDDIQEILANVLPAATRQAQPATAVAAPRELTPEEFDRTFNVFKPSDRLLADMRSDDPAKALAAIYELRDGLIRQSMTMAEYRIKQYIDNLSSEFKASVEPLQTYVSESQARSFRDDFFKEHPDLEPYETIVDAISTKLSAVGYQGKSRKEVMDRFATDTQTVVDSLLKAGKVATNGNGGAAETGSKTTATSRGGKMAALSGGGQGGGSRPTAGAGAVKGPAGIEIFD